MSPIVTQQDQKTRAGENLECNESKVLSTPVQVETSTPTPQIISTLESDSNSKPEVITEQSARRYNLRVCKNKPSYN